MRVLALSLISAVFAATVGLGWLFDQIYSRYLQQESDLPPTTVTMVENFASDFKKLINNAGFDQEQLNNLVSQWPSNSHYKLSLQPLKSLSLPAELSGQLKSGEPLTLASDSDIAVYYYLPNLDQLLVLTTAQLSQDSNNDVYRYLFTSLFYLSLLLLMLVWLSPLINRLLALRSAAQQFGKGDLSQRVEAGSVSYIRDLEVEFNHMAQRISDLVGDVKLLSSAVSHDLRTPLATIRFGIDTLLEEDDPILRKKFEQRISDNVDEMIQLVEILLNYARLDQNLVTLNKSQIDVSTSLHQIVQSYHSEHITIQNLTGDKTNTTILADKNYLSMLIKNLLQNALQHCTSKVHVAYQSSSTGVEINISDDGNGIAPEQRNQIIKPFVRGNSEHKGYGIGLAIVQRILHWHNGTLTITNDSQLGGAKFTVWLPVGDK